MKTDFKPIELLNRVNECGGDVLFKTKEGDILNLHSKLSQFVFVSIFSKPELLKGAVLEIMDDEDKKLLADFL